MVPLRAFVSELMSHKSQKTKRVDHSPDLGQTPRYNRSVGEVAAVAAAATPVQPLSSLYHLPPYRADNGSTGRDGGGIPAIREHVYPAYRSLSAVSWLRLSALLLPCCLADGAQTTVN